MRQAKYTAKSSFCRICTAKASIINYGALSCNSCKTFFRRHGCRIRNIRSCRYERHCKITLETRKMCTSCRLSKCFAVGMTSDFIRKEFHNVKNRSSIEFNSKQPASCQSYMSLPQIMPLDLLCHDRSSLTTSEWRSFSNVIHAFDKFSLVSSIRRMIESLNIAEPTISIDLSQTFDLFASFYTSAESFISSSTDFRVLTVAEQSSLFQRNLHGLFNLCGTFMLRDGGIFDNSRNECLLVPLYGTDIVRKTKFIIKRLTFDSTLVKMMHIIFAFSTNCYTVNYDMNMNNDALLIGTFRLFGSQNVYTEILWKYMLFRYGDMEAAVRFAALIKQMLDLITLSAGIYTHNVHHQILVDGVVEQAKIALIHKDNDSTALWGKT